MRKRIVSMTLAIAIIFSMINLNIFSLTASAESKIYSFEKLDASQACQIWNYQYLEWNGSYDVWSLKNSFTGEYLTVESDGTLVLTTELRKDAEGKVDASQTWAIQATTGHINLLNAARGYTTGNLNFDYNENAGEFTYNANDRQWSTFFTPVFTGAKGTARQNTFNNYGFVWWQDNYSIGQEGTIILKYKDTDMALKSEGPELVKPKEQFYLNTPTAENEVWVTEYSGYDTYDNWAIKSKSKNQYLTRNADGTVTLANLSKSGDTIADNQLWAIEKTDQFICILNKEGGYWSARLNYDAQNARLYTASDAATVFYPHFVNGDIANRQATYNDNGFVWWQNNNAIGTSAEISLSIGESDDSLVVTQNGFSQKRSNNFTNLWQYDYVGWDSAASYDCWTLKNVYTGKYLTRNADGSVVLMPLKKDNAGTISDTQIFAIPQDSNNNNINILSKSGGYSSANLNFISDSYKLLTSSSWDGYFSPRFCGDKAYAKQAAFYNYGFCRWQENFTIGDSGTFMLYYTSTQQALQANDIEAIEGIQFAQLDYADVNQIFSYNYVKWDGEYDLYSIMHLASGKYLTLEPDGKVTLTSLRNNESQYFAFGNGNSERLICKAYGRNNLINCVDSAGYDALYLDMQLSESWDSYYRFHFVSEDSVALQNLFDSKKAANGHGGWNRGDIVGNCGYFVIEYKESGYVFTAQGQESLFYTGEDRENRFSQWEYTYAGYFGNEDTFYIKNVGTGLYLYMTENGVAFAEKSESEPFRWTMATTNENGTMGLRLKGHLDGAAYYLNSAMSDLALTNGIAVPISVQANFGTWFYPTFFNDGANDFYNEKGFLYHIGEAPYSDSKIGKSGIMQLSYEKSNQYLTSLADVNPLNDPVEETTDIKGVSNALIASAGSEVYWNFKLVKSSANTKFYRITNQQSGLLLTGFQDGTVIQRTENGMANQLWEIKNIGDNEYAISNVGVGGGLYIQNTTNLIKLDLTSRWTAQAKWYVVNSAADIVGHLTNDSNAAALPLIDGDFMLCERMSVAVLSGIVKDAEITQWEITQNFQMTTGDAGMSTTDGLKASVVKSLAESNSNMLKLTAAAVQSRASLESIDLGETSLANPKGIFFQIKTDAKKGARIGVAAKTAQGTVYGTMDSVFAVAEYSPDQIGFPALDTSQSAQQWEYSYVGWDGTYDTWTFRNVATNLYLTRKEDGTVCLTEQSFAANGSPASAQVWGVPINNEALQLVNKSNGTYCYLNASYNGTSVKLDSGDTSASTWFVPVFLGENAKEAQNWFNSEGFCWHKAGKPDYSASAIGKTGYLSFNYKDLYFGMEGYDDKNKISVVGKLDQNGFAGYVFVPMAADAFVNNTEFTFYLISESGEWENSTTYIDNMGYFGSSKGKLGQISYENFILSGKLPSDALAEPYEMDGKNKVTTTIYPNGNDKQLWRLTKVQDHYLISNKYSGGYLTTDDAGKMTMQNYNGSNSQLWHLTPYESGYMLINVALNAPIVLDGSNDKLPYVNLSNKEDRSAIWFFALDDIQANDYVNRRPSSTATPDESSYFIICDYLSKRALQSEAEINEGGEVAPKAKITISAPEIKNADSVLCLLKVKFSAAASGLPSGLADEIVWSIVGDPNGVNGKIEKIDDNITGEQQVMVQFVNTGKYIIRVALKADLSIYADYRIQVKADADDLVATILNAEHLNEIDYSIDSWKVLSDSIAQAKAIMEDETSSQAAYIEIQQLIEKMMDSLVLVYDSTTETSTFNLPGSMTISEKFLNLAREYGRKLIFNVYDKSKLLYTWTFEGAAFDNEKISDIDLSVSFTVNNQNEIVLAAGTDKNADLNMSYKKTLPPKTYLKAYVGNILESGSKANLFRFNPIVGIREITAENLPVVNGYIEFNALYGAQYFANAVPILVVDSPQEDIPPEMNEPEEPEQPEDDNALTLEKVQEFIANAEEDLVTIRLTTLETFTKEMQEAFRKANKRVRFELADDENVIYLVQQFESFENINNDIPLGLNKNSANQDSINKLVDRQQAAQTISFRYTGEMPGTVKIIVSKQAALDKNTAMYLYYYDANGTLVKLTTSLAVSNDNQYLAFEIQKGGDYVVVNAMNDCQTNQSFPLWAWIVIGAGVLVLFTLAIALVIIVTKRRKTAAETNTGTTE